MKLSLLKRAPFAENEVLKCFIFFFGHDARLKRRNADWKESYKTI